VKIALILIGWLFLPGKALAEVLPDPQHVHLPSIYRDQIDLGLPFREFEIDLLRSLVRGAFTPDDEKISAFDDTAERFHMLSPGEKLDLVLAAFGLSQNQKVGQSWLFTNANLIEFRSVFLQMLNIDMGAEDLGAVHRFLQSLRELKNVSAMPNVLDHGQASFRALREVGEIMRSQKNWITIHHNIPASILSGWREFENLWKAELIHEVSGVDPEKLRVVIEHFRDVRQQVSEFHAREKNKEEGTSESESEFAKMGAFRDVLRSLDETLAQTARKFTDELPGDQADLWLNDVRSVQVRYAEVAVLDELVLGLEDLLNMPVRLDLTDLASVLSRVSSIGKLGSSFADEIEKSLESIRFTDFRAAPSENKINWSVVTEISPEFTRTGALLRHVRSLLTISILRELSTIVDDSSEEHVKRIADRMTGLWRLRLESTLAELGQILTNHGEVTGASRDAIANFRIRMRDVLEGHQSLVMENLLAALRTFRSQKVTPASEHPLVQGIKGIPPLKAQPTLRPARVRILRLLKNLEQETRIDESFVGGVEGFRSLRAAVGKSLNAVHLLHQSLRDTGYIEELQDHKVIGAWAEMSERGVLERLSATVSTIAREVLRRPDEPVPREFKLAFMKQVELAVNGTIGEVRKFMRILASSDELRTADPVAQDFNRFVFGEYFSLLHESFFRPMLDDLLATRPKSGGDTLVIVFRNAGPHFKKFVQAEARDPAASENLKTFMKRLESSLRPTAMAVLEPLWRQRMPGFYPEKFVALSPRELGVGSLFESYWVVVQKNGEEVDLAMRSEVPGVREFVYEDERVFNLIVKRVEENPKFADTVLASIRDFMDTSFEQVREELDVELTVRNQEQAVRLLSRDAILRHGRNRYKVRLRVPKVHFPEFAKNGMMFMDLVKGASKIDAELSKMPAFLRTVVEWMAQVQLGETLAGSGFLHADPHLGNSLARLDPNDEFALDLFLLDFGLTGQLNRNEQRAVVGTALAMSRVDLPEIERLGRTLLEEVPNDQDLKDAIDVALARAKTKNDVPSIDYLLTQMARRRMRLPSSLRRLNRFTFILDSLVQGGADTLPEINHSENSPPRRTIGDLIIKEFTSRLRHEIPKRAGAALTGGWREVPASGVPASTAEILRTVACQVHLLPSKK